MNPHGWVWDLVGWAALPIVAILIGVLIYRKFVSEFPIFFSYLVATEIIGITRFAAASAPHHVYYYIYWISDIVYTFFALSATYELFIKRLFPGFYKIRFYRYIFLTVACLTTVLAIAIALVSGHAKVLAATIHGYNFIRAAILIFFVGLMMVMGRQWKKTEFGIAFGFGLDVSTSLAALGIWSHTPAWTLAIDRISVIAYDVASLIWLYCFLSAPTIRTNISSPTLPPGALRDAKKWEE